MSEPQRFDFATNAWVRDDFLTRRTVELPAPTTPPAEGRWTAAAPTARRSYAYQGAVAATVGLPLAGYLVGEAVGMFSALAVLVVGLVLWHNREPSLVPVRAEERDLRLMETTDDPDVCLVELEIVFDGRPVGKDRGVAWFADGTLLFSGRRTSFAVGGEDVLPPSYWSEYGRERASALPDDAIPLRAIRPRTYLLLTPLERAEKVAHQQARHFTRHRHEFRERPVASAPGTPRQWPPFAP